MAIGMNKLCRWAAIPLLLLAFALPLPAQDKTTAKTGKNESTAKPKTSNTTKKPAKPSVMVLRLRKLYHYIYQGNLKDVKTNQRIAEQLTNKAKGLKREAKHSKSKQEKYEETQALADLFTKLAEQNRIVLKAFEGHGQNGLVTRAALEEIPELEQEIVRISGKQIKRNWLTFAEVDELRRRKMIYKRGVPDALPHLRELWEEKRDKRKRTK